ncbi:MAG: type II toxin-antitoxin system mRNA interferase toxin, RelE/StbE family [Erysipelotrichaceae bacterium]|nr:type II toxin-antitoxin system mRNA interferase toxin, RelE/StbE family [Erysipelotrichaceae bacterium]
MQKTLNRIVKRKKNNISELLKVIDCLASGIKLAHKYKDHSLSKDRRKYGKYNARECHIENDFLLIYSLTSIRRRYLLSI